MKKNLLAGFTGLCLLLATSVTNAQLSFIKMETLKGLSFYENSGLSNFTAVDPKNVNPKALKSLSKAFKDATAEKWYETSSSFVAKFAMNDVDYRVDYDKKGRWLYTIRTYDEAKLPQDIRHMVKSTYYDFNILLVQEIQMGQNPLTYIVHLESKTEIINLRVSDGEMDEWQKFSRSK